ncbi:response regulator transcription factor [Pontiella agarivorans]|uniref:Response regulator transcription factor n=1 Tax=Pontiella agarivorans TaxID=3038953 RepID=A0ABU5N1D1_9BACT|nr:response regulator transcription factor [Pontiella agarivorans]MDZ8120237.1 response regulator transcription factor [Pontiella agarivorans]
MGKAKKTVWIIEDEAHFRNHLARLINLDDVIECTAKFESYEEALPSIESAAYPDLLLLDLNLPGMHGLEVIRELTEKHPDIHILVLTVDENRKTVFDAICAGAAGYLVKNDPFDDILKGIHQVMEGGAPLSSSIASYVLQYFKPKQPFEELNEREVEILEMLANGDTRKEIAAKLHVAPTTVDYHLRSIYVKLQVNSAAGAVAKALRDRLIE